MDKQELERLCGRLIAGAGQAFPALPLTPWKDFDLVFAFEYPAHRFEEELGFWASVMGMSFLSVDETYAICTDAKHSYTFAFKRALEAADLSRLRVQWFTDGLDAVLASLDGRGARYQLVRHSVRQRYAVLESPSGMPVEIWSGDEGE